jgi:haloalkane dehalogenase
VVLVPHDSSGIVAINFAVEYPEKVAALQILNSAYDDTPLNVWPEMIVLFAEPGLTALANAFAQSPEQFRWLLDWQRQKFEDPLPASQKQHFIYRTAGGREFRDSAEFWSCLRSVGGAFLRRA